MQKQTLVRRLTILKKGAELMTNPELASDIARLITDVKASEDIAVSEKPSQPVVRFQALSKDEKNVVDGALLSLYNAGAKVRADIKKLVVGDALTESDTQFNIIGLSEATLTGGQENVARAILLEYAKMRGTDPMHYLTEVILGVSKA